jgi:hypothetical protein
MGIIHKIEVRKNDNFYSSNKYTWVLKYVPYCNVQRKVDIFNFRAIKKIRFFNQGWWVWYIFCRLIHDKYYWCTTEQANMRRKSFWKYRWYILWLDTNYSKHIKIVSFCCCLLISAYHNICSENFASVYSYYDISDACYHSLNIWNKNIFPFTSS